jgi:hypothetical protein
MLSKAVVSRNEFEITALFSIKIFGNLEIC